MMLRDFLLILLSISVSAETIYVDNLLPGPCASYSIEERDCAGSDGRAYPSLSSLPVGPGDTILVRGGAYDKGLSLSKGGSPGAYITIRNYLDEGAVITGAAIEPAIDISDRGYVVIQGLRVSNVKRWLYAVRTNHSVIRNMTFERAIDSGGSSKTGLFFQEAHFNRIEGNVMTDSTQDNLALINSDNNLVKDNRITRAKHTLWTIKCGDYNIIKGNYFHNELEKIGEIFDCDSVGFSHEFTIMNSTKHNLVEGNEFAYTPSSGDSSPYAGIQFAGQESIIRKNIFHDTVGPALDFTIYSDEARFNLGNRVYNNVFIGTDFAGISIASGAVFYDNIIKNNILADSVFVANDKRWQWYQVLKGKPVQLMTARLDSFVFEGNILYSPLQDNACLIAYGVRTSSSNPPCRNLSHYETDYPAVFRENLIADPKLDLDFIPLPGSPALDSGRELTKAVGSGSVSELIVEDPLYFSDGYGMMDGDMISVGGKSARITRIDGNTLILDRDIAWSPGDPVSLEYSGEGPDVGAFEAVSDRVSDADLDSDGEISDSEILLYIGNWKRGFVTLPHLIDAIRIWKS